MVYIVKEHVNFYAKLGLAVGFGSLSLINSLDEVLECELWPLSHVCLIKDGASRVCHVAHEEESSRDFLFDRKLMSEMSPCIQ